MSRFTAWARTAESILIRTLIIVLLLLLAGQSLVKSENTRSFFSYVYRLEGIDYGMPVIATSDDMGATFMRSGSDDVLTITVLLLSHSSLPDARLLIDGFTIADFTEPRVTVEVNPGNHVELDTRGIPQGLLFRVVDVAPGISAPREGDEILVQDEKRTLAVIETH